MDEQSVNGDGSKDNEPGEMYFNKATGRTQRRRGKRKIVSRGPECSEEGDMTEEFRAMVHTGRKMDGRLAQSTYKDITMRLTRWRLAMERYSFENTGDTRGINPHVIMDEVEGDMPYVDAAPSEPDKDIYENLRDDLT